MNVRAIRPEHVALIALAGFALYAASVGTDTAVRNISRALFGSLDDIFAGAVEGAGQVIGVPVTNAERCKAAQAANSVFDASLYCDASEFLRWMAKGNDPAFRGGGGGFSGDGGATGTW